MRSTTILLALLPVLGFSQADTTSIGHVPRLNVIKIGGSSGFANTLSFSYERVLNPDLSVALTASYMLPIQPEGLLNLETEDLVIGGDRELTGIFITPEVKWYPTQRSTTGASGAGFYVGAYARWSDMRYTSSISGVSESNGSTVNADLQMDLIEYGLGIDAGYQLLMCKDRVAVDFVFFGPRFSAYTLKVDAELDGDGELYTRTGRSAREIPWP